MTTTTTEKVVFLAPLDPVSAGGHAKVVFGFDYVWDVYKPAHKSRLLHAANFMGDQLVARFDSKLERKTNTSIFLGFWLEDTAMGKDEALAGGLAGFVTFLGASKLDAKAIREPQLRRRTCSS